MCEDRSNFCERYLQEEEPEMNVYGVRDSFNPCGKSSEQYDADTSFNHHFRHGPSLSPEHYDGSEDFDIYIEQFECIADLGRWTEKERALALAAYLKGQARRFYISLSEKVKSSYQLLAYQLRQRFSSSSRPSFYWTAKFENRFRLPGEKIADFSDELLLLVRRAYPHLDIYTQHQLALQQWFKSMSPEVKWRCIERNCQTIREAEEVADMYEIIMHPREK